MEKKRNFVEWAMHYRGIIILVTCCLVALGIVALSNMRKNEFPDFTVRQGLVVAAAPGLSSDEVAERVAKPLEQYIFTYKEVKKANTFSQSRDGMCYIQVELNDDLTDKDTFWSKFKHGVNEFASELPNSVLAVVVQDDFGDTSALLIAMESKEKTYRELDDYMDELQSRLRTVSAVGRMTVSGAQDEQIGVYLDPDHLSHYGLSSTTLAAQLMAKGFQTSGGSAERAGYNLPVYVSESMNTVYDVQETIVFSTADGQVVRLKDVADVVREYPEPTSYILYNETKCLVLSVEMKKGKNIVEMGEDVGKIIDAYEEELPEEVNLCRITDQSEVVSNSVQDFLGELGIAIVAVIIVVMLLLPLRVALVAASTIPITIFIALGLFYCFGMELNTVTLAALIVTLGMIVDNSIVIIDNYLELLGEGYSRWGASIKSATHFFKSVFTATLAISITFFPFLFITDGLIHDFLLSFPWAISIVLFSSLAVAVLLVPFLQYFFIRKPLGKKRPGKKSFSILNLLQRGYNRLLDLCFAWPKLTLTIGVATMIVGGILLSGLPIRIMPMADRNQLAVELSMPMGTSVKETAIMADSVANMLKEDERVVSITSFLGCSSPRFHNAYAPQIPGEHYAQFIINTSSAEDTETLLDDYADPLPDRFPGCRVRFKQLSYSEAVYPIEVRISGESLDSIVPLAEKIKEELSGMGNLLSLHTDLFEPQPAMEVNLHENEAARLGVSRSLAEMALAMHYSDGLPMATVWEGTHGVDITLKTQDKEKEPIVPVMGGMSAVPLRAVADVNPVWKHGQIVRRNGRYTVSVRADVGRKTNPMQITKEVQEIVAKYPLPYGVDISWGGELEQTDKYLTPIMGGLVCAAAIIFFILLSHYKRIGLAAFIFASMMLCLCPTALGIMIQGLEFSVTCVLGIVSLMGIIVRNGIIMVDYAEELRKTEKLPVRDAIYHSARRRMRPIFLTSAAAAMGVIPMILGKSSLWMPMGTVICYGTLLTMILIVTILPVAYLLCFRESSPASGTKAPKQA